MISSKLPRRAALAGAVIALFSGESLAKRRRQRRQASHHPGKHKDNRKGKHKGSDKCDACPSGCPFTAVQAAIDAASPGATIKICAGTYVGSITLNKDVTLVGAGDGDNPAIDTILDGNSLDTVVEISAGRTVSLIGLRITKGSSSFGGGIRNLGALTMKACTVIDNQSNDAGAGIQSETGSSLTMTDCAVSGNHNSGSVGGGGIRSAGALTMTNCSVSDNTASDSGVGAGLFLESVRSIVLTSCVVGPNNEAGSGGGIFLAGNSLTLDATTVSGNKAINASSGRGGGIFVEPLATLKLRNGSRVRENMAGQDGGGIYCIGTVEVDGGFVGPNNTAGNSGGGIFNAFISGPGAGTVTVKANSSVTGNNATLSGGGILNESTLTCSAGTVTSNTAGNPAVANNCVDSGSGSGCASCSA